MILYTVVPFSSIFPEEEHPDEVNQSPPPSTNPDDYLKDNALPGGILPGEPLPDPVSQTNSPEGN